MIIDSSNKCYKLLNGGCADSLDLFYVIFTFLVLAHMGPRVLVGKVDHN